MVGPAANSWVSMTAASWNVTVADVTGHGTVIVSRWSVSTLRTTPVIPVATSRSTMPASAWLFERNRVPVAITVVDPAVVLAVKLGGSSPACLRLPPYRAKRPPRDGNAAIPPTAAGRPGVTIVAATLTGTVPLSAHSELGAKTVTRGTPIAG